MYLPENLQKAVWGSDLYGYLFPINILPAFGRLYTPRLPPQTPLSRGDFIISAFADSSKLQRTYQLFKNFFISPECAVDS